MSMFQYVDLKLTNLIKGLKIFCFTEVMSITVGNVHESDRFFNEA
jgi:hypothetical protein